MQYSQMKNQKLKNSICKQMEYSGLHISPAARVAHQLFGQNRKHKVLQHFLNNATLKVCSFWIECLVPFNKVTKRPVYVASCHSCVALLLDAFFKISNLLGKIARQHDRISEAANMLNQKQTRFTDRPTPMSVLDLNNHISGNLGSTKRKVNLFKSHWSTFCQFLLIIHTYRTKTKEKHINNLVLNLSLSERLVLCKSYLT